MQQTSRGRRLFLIAQLDRSRHRCILPIDNSKQPPASETDQKQRARDPNGIMRHRAHHNIDRGIHAQQTLSDPAHRRATGTIRGDSARQKSRQNVYNRSRLLPTSRLGGIDPGRAVLATGGIWSERRRALRIVGHFP
jgi:hypothetical protein